MKKIISIILSLALTFATVALLFACGEDESLQNESDHVCELPEPIMGENGNWWIGDTDTGIPVNPPTPELTQGENGNWYLNGIDTGYPVYPKLTEGENGNWFQGDKDTGIPVEPEIPDPVVGENGNWWIGEKDLGISATPPAPELTRGENGNWYLNGIDTGYPVYPKLTEGENGNWFQGDKDTGIPVAPEIPDPVVGENGNWWIGEKDLGISATPPAPELTQGENGNWYLNGIDTGYPVYPKLTEGENGNWFQGDKDTGIPVEPEIPDPVVGENGNWWIGDKDTGISSIPETLKVTKTETRIVNSAGVDYCVITITFSDGSTKDIVVEMPKIEDNFETTATITNGYGGANGIICLMTDNDSGKFETLALLDELYIEYGLVGGLGTVVKNLYTDKTYTTPKTADVAKWQEFLDTGRWKIINHSMTHTTYMDTVNGVKVINEDRLYSELVRSAELLRELFPGERVLTYANTGTQSAIGESSDPTNIRQCERELIAEYYIGGRFLYSGAVAFDDLEWNNLPNTLLSRANLATILNNIDKAAKEGKYYMVYNHYVIEDELFDTVNESSWTNYSTAKALCERVAQYVNDGSVWNAHFEDAIMYMRERDTASLSAIYENGNIKVNLTDEMDDSIYNHKLTVKLTVPEGWDAVRIIQGSEVSYAEVTEYFGEYYALVNILPDGGEATIEKAALSDIPEEKPEEIKPTPDIGTPAVPPTVAAPEIYTFDTLDGYLGGAIVFDNSGLASSKVSVVTEGENKVFKMEKPEGSTNPTATFKAVALSGASYFVIDTKLKLERTSSSGEVYLSLTGQNDAYAARAYITVKSDQTLDLTFYRSGDSSKAIAKNIGSLGEWINLKIIYTLKDGAASITLFVNGTETLTTPYHYNASSAPIPAADIKTVRINPSQSYLGNLYLDDLSAVCTNKLGASEAPHTHSFVDGVCDCGEKDPDYNPPEADCEHSFSEGICTKCGAEDPDYTPTEPVSQPTYTFDTTDGIVFDNQSVTTNTISIVDEGNEKLLKFEKPSGKENPSVLFTGETTSGATSFVCEMDVRVEITSASGEIYFSLATKNGYTYAYRSYIKINLNGSVDFADYSKGTGSTTNTKSGIDVNVGTTFKIKIVYTTDSEGAITATVYINNVEIISTDNYHDRDAQLIEASSVEKLRVNPSASFTGSIYIDNLTVKQLAE